MRNRFPPANNGLNIRKICPCGREFYCVPSRADRTRCCSKKCQYDFARRPSGLKYKIVVKNKTWFLPGHIGGRRWRKGERASPRTEFKPGQRFSPNTEFKKGDIPHNYKGDIVGYYALHSWIYRKLGKPKRCVFCKSRENLRWANKSHEYHRRLSDWIALCQRCHSKYDRENGWGKAVAKYPELRR